MFKSAEYGITVSGLRYKNRSIRLVETEKGEYITKERIYFWGICIYEKVTRHSEIEKAQDKISEFKMQNY